MPTCEKKSGAESGSCAHWHECCARQDPQEAAAQMILELSCVDGIHGKSWSRRSSRAAFSALRSTGPD